MVTFYAESIAASHKHGSDSLLGFAVLLLCRECRARGPRDVALVSERGELHGVVGGQQPIPRHGRRLRVRHADLARLARDNVYNTVFYYRVRLRSDDPPPLLAAGIGVYEPHLKTSRVSIKGNY